MGSVVATFSRSGRPDPSFARRMIAAAPHRGSVAETVVLGNCVVAGSRGGGRDDVSSTSDGSFAIAFAGRLDNAAELTSSLGEGGKLDEQPTPAEIVAATFRVHGERTPAYLRGTYCVVATDGRRLLCFRDHLGFGSLFYTDDPHGYLVATEAKQVVAGTGRTAEPDLDVLERILYQDNDDDSLPSAIRGVRRLPKSTLLVADGVGLRTSRYWDPSDLLETARLSESEVRERFHELFERAAARMLTGEASVSLSGGIDSPTVAAFAAPAHLAMTGRPLSALSATYPDYPAVDESALVRLVADRLGLPLQTYQMTSRPLDRLVDWMQIADGPVPTTALPHYEEHYRRTRALGYRTVLTGELAELVCDTRNYLVSHLLFRGRLADAYRRAKELAADGSSRSVARHLASAVMPRALLAARLGRQSTGIPAWIDRARANEAAARSIVAARHRWEKVQLGAFIGPGMTVEADDICQEICGVRARRPWADVDLWEFFLSLPADVKFPDMRSKTLVRSLMRGALPDEILDRRDKTVFDDAVMATTDYPTLRKLLVSPTQRMPGVQYDMLEECLSREDLSLWDLTWARNLAAVHAFLSAWD